jgi:hypothetical protein
VRPDGDGRSRTRRPLSRPRGTRGGRTGADPGGGPAPPRPAAAVRPRTGPVALFPLSGKCSFFAGYLRRIHHGPEGSFSPYGRTRPRRPTRTVAHFVRSAPSRPVHRRRHHAIRRPSPNSLAQQRSCCFEPFPFPVRAESTRRVRHPLRRLPGRPPDTSPPPSPPAPFSCLVPSRPSCRAGPVQLPQRPEFRRLPRPSGPATRGPRNCRPASLESTAARVLRFPWRKSNGFLPDGP